MLGDIKELINKEATLSVDKDGEVTDRDIQTVCAAFFLCMSGADGDLSEEEVATMSELMQKEFSIFEAEEISSLLQVGSNV